MDEQKKKQLEEDENEKIYDFLFKNKWCIYCGIKPCKCCDTDGCGICYHCVGKPAFSSFEEAERKILEHNMDVGRLKLN